MTVKNIGTTAFNVPAEHIVDVDLTFLPDSPSEGMIFLLNPGASRQEHISVGVERAADVCKYGEHAVIDMIPRVCAVAKGKTAAKPIGKLVKAFRVADDHTQWEYRDEHGVVAACSRSTRGGSCDASFAWRDLIYSIKFNDGQIGRLPELKAEADRLLNEWAAA